jgi:hypothetical protein
MNGCLHSLIIFGSLLQPQPIELSAEVKVKFYHAHDYTVWWRVKMSCTQGRVYLAPGAAAPEAILVLEELAPFCKGDACLQGISI